MADSFEIVARILAKYMQISNIEQSAKGTQFELHGNKYEIILSDDFTFPIVCIIDCKNDYPHIFIDPITVDGKELRAICLIESDAEVAFLYSDEEKICFCIERLITLTELTSAQVIDEYQKEFAHYWDSACFTKSKYASYNYQLYLDSDREYLWLEQLIYKNNIIRFSDDTRYFNDTTRYVQTSNIPVLYLPLLDTRDIIPPIKQQPWTSTQINDIVNGAKYQRISAEAYQMIKTTSYSKKEIVLVIKLNNYYLGCIVQFKNPGTAKLNYKFESQIKNVIPISIRRCDFSYLNKQIGNVASDMRLAIVGAGSLGSYIAAELVRAGYMNITIIDPDEYSYENTFRHSISLFSDGYRKVTLLAAELERIHPEVNIHRIIDYLNPNTFEKHRLGLYDAIIFTVGSSDMQLRMNRYFLEKQYSMPVYYAWLEHDGDTSHVAKIQDYSKGCFECIFTNPKGDRCNNVVNITKPNTIKYIRKGCGGTRVPYGNKTLLTATAMLLQALRNDTESNRLYSYHDGTISSIAFPRNERCACCAIHE